MDEFGFEPHHARVAARASNGGEDEGVGERPEPEGADAEPDGAGAEAESAAAAAATAALAAVALDDAEQSPAPAQDEPTSTSPLSERSLAAVAEAKQRHDSDGLRDRRRAAQGSRRSDMPRPKAAQASAQNSPPADDADNDALHVRPTEMEESVPLPQAFTAQYLGSRPASGLWGVRHTRRPVDEMVATARASPAPLPWNRLRVSAAGVAVFHGDASGASNVSAVSGGRRTGAHGQAAVAMRAIRHHDIAAISYGVQDLVYTRVFCFIVVTDQRSSLVAGAGPGAAPVFQCHAYVCESRAAARALTHALAAAFRAFSRELRRAGPGARTLAKNRFKIDLRSPEQLAADMEEAPETSDA